MRNEDFKALADTCEGYLRAGLINRVEQVFAGLNLAKVPPEWRLPLARICRRASLIPAGLRLLAPIVRPDKQRSHHKPLPGQSAEYAALLIRAGAIKEALALLKTIDGSHAPESWLFRVFGHFANWEYEEAIPLLQNYLAAPLPEYQIFVGRVNLAAAYLGTGRMLEAEQVLRDNVAYASERGHTRLLANNFEMMAQLHIYNKRFGEALTSLEQAAQALGQSQANDQLFVRKWQAVVDALGSGSLDKLEAFRSEALQRRDWESVRDTDFHELRVRFSQERFEHLYFGTPFASYRAYLCKGLGVAAPAAPYVLGQGSRQLDLNELNGDIAHRVLNVLFSDFYRPANIGRLFAGVYPDEFFDIFSSPQRVHQSLRRTRQWLTENKLPLSITEDRGQYRASVGADLRVVLMRGGIAVDPQLQKLSKLREAFGGRDYFSTAEAQAHLQLSRSSMKRLISWAVESGQVHRFGDARATRYYF